LPEIDRKRDACFRTAENAQDPRIQLFRTVALQYRELVELIQDGPNLRIVPRCRLLVFVPARGFGWFNVMVQQPLTGAASVA